VSTYSQKAGDITRTWHVIDATDVVLGRLAVQAATLLRGKHKPTYSPNLDGGDFVIVINAEKVAISGNKRTTTRASRVASVRAASVRFWTRTPTASWRRPSRA
jgi:ribosomal protein L13